MLQVFWPAMAIMKRLRFPYKFSLIGLLSLLAIGYLFVSHTQNLRAAIDANRNELAGLEVIQPVTGFLRNVQQHRGLTSGVLGGEEKLRDKIAGKVADIAKAIDKVEAANIKYGSTLKFSDEWRTVKADWEKLNADWPRLTVNDNLQRHGALIKQTLEIITRVRESSGLILDPDLGSYYLMLIATEHLPDLLERMGRMRAAGTGVLAKKEIDEAGKIKLSTPVGALQKVLDDVKHDLQRAALANPSIKGKLDEFSGKIDASASYVLRIVLEDIISGRLETPADVYFGRATEAIDIGYNQLSETIFPTLDQLINQRVASQNGQFQLSVGLSALTIFGFLYIAIGAYLAIIAGIAQLNAGAETIESGDLTARVAYDGKDELQSVALRFNAMATGFGQLISRIQNSADSVSKASESLASNAEQVARSSSLQTDSASSMAAAVEELTVSVGEVKRHADEAHALSERSGQFAEQGSSVVGKTVSEMNVIADSVTASSAVIEELGQQSGKISDIVNVIKDIADQTNLLALNAAIEAARAGETGRGFAVVADEVRKLAERTTKSTAEISAMVKTIQDGTARAVSSMQGGVSRVRSGVALAQEAGDSMQQIGTGAAQVVEVVGGISLALKEQTEAANEIAGNVERIAQTAEENNSAVGATARTAQELQVLAKALHDEAHRFRVR